MIVFFCCTYNGLTIFIQPLGLIMINTSFTRMMTANTVAMISKGVTFYKTTILVYICYAAHLLQRKMAHNFFGHLFGRKIRVVNNQTIRERDSLIHGPFG